MVVLAITDSSDAPRLLREARQDAGMTQRALAEAAGIQQSHIAAIESGKRKVSAELLTRILRAAGYRPSIPLEREADAIRESARENGLDGVRVFGSTIRGQDRFDSDVDLLVDIVRPDVPFGLPSFIAQVEDLIRFPVDVVVDDGSGISPIVRDETVPL